MTRSIGTVAVKCVLALWMIGMAAHAGEGGTPHPHWAFNPVVRPEVPLTADTQWVQNPIDAFVLARLDVAGLEPAQPATKQELLRRSHYDLTGLPPTPEEVRTFLADADADAYEQAIDRLLNSPGYGIRWGRHWLDLVRFAETDSYERDNPKPNAWRYRDYIIRSLNEDKPYDRFVREQLAGDELPADSYDPIIATGYYRLGLWDDEPVDATQAYYDHLDDVVTTTGQVLLGLTINCARCHDHKIDPISQRDYYRFMAFFHNILNNVRKGKFKDSAFTLNTQVPLANPEKATAWRKANETLDKQLIPIQSRLQELGDKVISQLSQADKAAAAGGVQERQRLIADNVDQVLSVEERAEWISLREQRDQLIERRPPELLQALAVVENSGPPPATFVLARGNAQAREDEVRPGYPGVLNVPDPQLTQSPPDGASCGRRTVLANWIASSQNILASRVIVNRVWQHHFSRGIVASSSDFGLGGIAPTHPKLLDWLASECVRQGWSLKRLHRLIMTSATYRMSAHPTETVLVADPDNDLFSRQNMRRLSAEELRDSVLAVSGQLNLEMKGPSVYTKVHKEVLHGQSRPGYGWTTSEPSQQARRSIYVHVKRSLVPPLLAIFDSADTDISCPVRFATTQPTQALELFNSEFASEQARQLAQRVAGETGQNPRDQVKRLLWLTTQRKPTAAEVDRGIDFIENLPLKDNANQEAAVSNYCLLVLNLNEFVYLD